MGIQRLFAGTPHAAEILAEAETLATDLHKASDAGFAALVVNTFGGPEHMGLDEASYVADVRRLVAGTLPQTPAAAQLA